LEGFYRFFERYQRITGESFYAVSAAKKTTDHVAGPLAEEAYRDFCNLMDDDFNTGGAVGKLYELVGRLNKFADDNRDFQENKGQAFADLKNGVSVLREMGQILGLFWAPIEKAASGDDKLVGGLMQLLIDLRAEARKAKNFALGDQIRKRLGEIGVTLEDRA